MNQRQLEFSSHTANLSLVRNFVRQFLAPHPFTKEETEMIVLGVDEACTNIIRHAYKNEEDQPITLTLEATSGGIRFRLRDFAKETSRARFAGRSLDQVKPGGLGVHLIRSTFDQVNYRRRQNGTELVLVKQFPIPPSAVGLEQVPQ